MLCVGVLVKDKTECGHIADEIRNFMAEKRYIFRVLEFSNREELLRECEKLDLLFININEDEKDEWSDSLRFLAVKCSAEMVFLTDQDVKGLFTDGVECGFLIKKEAFPTHLPAVFRGLIAYHGMTARQRLLLNMKGRQIVVRVQDIMYMERDKRMTRVICRDETLTTAADLSAMVERIHRHDMIRCHNSYVINFQYVKEFRRNEFVLKDGTVIPVSRRYLDEARKGFIMWVGE